MEKIQREDIHIISRHSNLTEKGVAKALKDNVYNDKEAWQKKSGFRISKPLSMMVNILLNTHYRAGGE